MFNNIIVVAKYYVMAVLPATTTTNERLFSTFRHLKIYLRSTKRDSLNGLGYLNSHRNINIKIEQALDNFFPRHDVYLKID